MKSIVLSTGRMNPPTKGHLKLIETMKAVSRECGITETLLCLTKTTDNERNPLTYDEKVNLLKHTGIKFAEDSNLFKTVERLVKNEDYKTIIIVIGSDRLPMVESVQKYALEWGAEFVDIVTIGRDDEDEISKISATLVRKAVKENDYESYKKMIGVQAEDTEPLWNLLRERLDNV